MSITRKTLFKKLNNTVLSFILAGQRLDPKSGAASLPLNNEAKEYALEKQKELIEALQTIDKKVEQYVGMRILTDEEGQAIAREIHSFICSCNKNEASSFSLQYAFRNKLMFIGKLQGTDTWIKTIIDPITSAVVAFFDAGTWNLNKKVEADIKDKQLFREVLDEMIKFMKDIEQEEKPSSDSKAISQRENLPSTLLKSLKAKIFKYIGMKALTEEKFKYFVQGIDTLTDNEKAAKNGDIAAIENIEIQLEVLFTEVTEYKGNPPAGIEFLPEDLENAIHCTINGISNFFKTRAQKNLPTEKSNDSPRDDSPNFVTTFKKIYEMIDQASSHQGESKLEEKEKDNAALNESKKRESNLRNAVRALEHITQEYVSKKNLTPQGAKDLAKYTKIFIGTCRRLKEKEEQDPKAFLKPLIEKAAKVYVKKIDAIKELKDDPTWKRVIVAVIGAVIGFFVGLCAGALAGPAAALTALVGGAKGAIIGATTGTIAFTGFGGLAGYSLFQSKNKLSKELEEVQNRANEFFCPVAQPTA